MFSSALARDVISYLDYGFICIDFFIDEYVIKLLISFHFTAVSLFVSIAFQINHTWKNGSYILIRMF